MEKIIDVKNLNFAYNGEMILREINFSIYTGDFVSLIGSNGAGKSTLIKLVLGELTPKEGSIKILGTDPKEIKKWYRVGYVPQNGLQSVNSFPASAEEIVQANLFSKIGLMKFPKKEHRIKTGQALELVGMTQYSKHLIGNLSGGQQQRILLARALVHDPEILILDEPTTGVDDSTVESFYNLIEELNKSLGITIFIVTHDVERVSKFVSRTFCLENGTLVELSKDDVKMELTHKHKHPSINARRSDD
ncbi:MAG: metal ABC transporter ATP-binding protein [Tissierellaceae bacterium]|nr:metal ABC transporter ATP-binding protein [Tissierellaceae bacterium]